MKGSNTATMSVARARAITRQHAQREQVKLLRKFPDGVQYALIELQGEAAKYNPYPEGEPRWHGLELAVKDWAERAAIWQVHSQAVEYTRKLCAELVRHPGLVASRENRMYPMNVDLTSLYNALQRYLVTLETALRQAECADKVTA